MVSRTRLPRSSRLGVPDDRLKRDVVGQLRKMPTERVKKYATLSARYVGDSPVLGMTKQLAQQELAERQAALATWAHGKQVLRPREPFLPKVAKGAQKAFQLAGRGTQEFFKVVSGEKARELEESIATVGMKPEEKANYLGQLRKERAAREKEESFALFPPDVDVPDLRVANVAEEGARELRRARREMLI